MHVVARGELRPDVYPIDNLEVVLSTITNAGLRPDALVLTGDLVNAGDEASYALLREHVAGCAAGLGAAAVYLPGNHDARGPFRQLLLDQPADDAPIDQVVWFGGLRLIALDSTVPGEEHGALDPTQLSWLASELARPAPDGTVVALHHPPITSPIASMARIALRDPQALGEVIAASDVLMVVCGHNHHASASALSGVPVWVSPASAYQSDVLSAAEYRGLPGCGFTRIDVGPAGAVATVVPLDRAVGPASSPEPS